MIDTVFFRVMGVCWLFFGVALLGATIATEGKGHEKLFGRLFWAWASFGCVVSFIAALSLAHLK